MAHQADLYEIGCDGFAILEQHMLISAKPQKVRAPLPPRHPNHQTVIHRKIQPLCQYVYQPQESLVYHAARLHLSHEVTTVITAHESSSIHHDAAVFMDFQRQRNTLKNVLN